MKAKLIFFFVTLILTSGCTSGNDDSVTLGDLWQWHVSAWNLLFSGYFSQLTILQFVWIICGGCGTLYILFSIINWIGELFD